jgi:excisionase family DNA binding protein
MEQKTTELILDALKKFQETAEGLSTSGSTREEHITSKEAAKRLNISLPTLHSYSKAGIIPKYYLGNRVLYKASEIELAPQKVPSFRLKGQKL